MKDMYGKEVNNGDFLVEGDNYGEVALFFKVIENKPVLVARWSIGMLDKYNTEIIRGLSTTLKEKLDAGETSVPRFMIDYFKNTAQRLDDVKSEELMLVEDINVKILNKFIDEGHEAITYTSSDGMDINEKPIAHFPDEQIVGKY